MSTKIDGLEGEPSDPITRQVPDDLLITAADPVSTYQMRNPRRNIAHAELQYTQAAYTERTTLPCAPLTFRDISQGLLPPIVSNATSVGVGRESNVDLSIDKIDMVVCSFALHLVESSSELFSLLRELSTKALWLVVLAPHKKPEVRTFRSWPALGFSLFIVDQRRVGLGEMGQRKLERVWHARSQRIYTRKASSESIEEIRSHMSFSEFIVGYIAA